MEKTLVYACRENKKVVAYRQSNQTLLVPNGKLWDSDQTMIEDKYGHRYARRLDLEQFTPGKMVFHII